MSGFTVLARKDRLVVFVFFTNNSKNVIDWNRAFFYANVKQVSIMKALQFHGGFVGLHFCQDVSGGYFIAYVF